MPSSFRSAVEANDTDRIFASFAADATFRNPANGHVVRDGRLAAGVVCAARSVFEDFVYVDELTTGPVQALVFRASIDGQDLEGLDLLRFDEDGLITEFTVMLRPWSIAEAFNAAMAPHFSKLYAEPA